MSLVDALIQALSNGDPKAASALIKVGLYVVRAILRVCSGKSAYEGQTPKVPRRRQKLLFEAARHFDSFPVVHSTRKRDNNDVTEMLASIPLGEASIFKTSHIAQDEMYEFFVHQVKPRFEGLRASPKRLTGLQGAIQALPPLRRATRNQWAKLITKFCASPEGFGIEKLRDPTHWLHRFANPQRQLAKRIKKAQARVRARFPGELGAIDATKKQVREMKIARMQITDSDVLTGLTEGISARLNNILKN